MGVNFTASMSQLKSKNYSINSKRNTLCFSSLLPLQYLCWTHHSMHMASSELSVNMNELRKGVMLCFLERQKSLMISTKNLILLLILLHLSTKLLKYLKFSFTCFYLILYKAPKLQNMPLEGFEMSRDHFQLTDAPELD